MFDLSFTIPFPNLLKGTIRKRDELVVMADSRKLRQRSPMIVATLERISTLITDDRATDEELELFRKAGIEVITVKVEERDAVPSVKTALP